MNEQRITRKCHKNLLLHWRPSAESVLSFERNFISSHFIWSSKFTWFNVKMSFVGEANSGNIWGLKSHNAMHERNSVAIPYVPEYTRYETIFREIRRSRRLNCSSVHLQKCRGKTITTQSVECVWCISYVVQSYCVCELCMTVSISTKSSSFGIKWHFDGLKIHSSAHNVFVYELRANAESFSVFNYQFRLFGIDIESK